MIAAAPKRKPAERFDGDPCVRCDSTTRYVSSRCCVNCTSRRSIARNKKTPWPFHKRRAAALMKLYGLTVEEFDRIFASQGSRCAICKTTSHSGQNWHVDHCHKTGAVRGILCSRCNPGLGNFDDSPDRLIAALNYLVGRGSGLSTPISDFLKRTT